MPYDDYGKKKNTMKPKASPVKVEHLGTGMAAQAAKKVMSAGAKRCKAAGGKWVNGACSFK